MAYDVRFGDVIQVGFTWNAAVEVATVNKVSRGYTAPACVIKTEAGERQSTTTWYT